MRRGKLKREKKPSKLVQLMVIFALDPLIKLDPLSSVFEEEQCGMIVWVEEESVELDKELMSLDS